MGTSLIGGVQYISGNFTERGAKRGIMRPYTNRNSETPLYLQIVNQFKAMIIRGELPDGFRMPSERHMAELISVHRNTIKRAYGELKADGYLTSIERKGFVVSYTKEAHLTGKSYSLIWSDIIRDEYINRRIERHFSSWFKHNVKYSFSGDVVLTEEQGSEDISELLIEMARAAEHNKYSVSHKQGTEALRKSIAEFVSVRGIHANPSEIQVISETFQAIEYLANTIIKNGDAVIIEEPVCPEVFRIFLSIGADVITADMDEEGICCKHLEALIAKNKPKLIYTNPDFQNPTGAVMSLERRKKLLELSYQYNIPIIEDDGCSGFRYDGRELPPLKALDQHDSVIYIYSFYFTIPSGIRMAFIIGNRRLISDISAIVQSRIVCADVVSQWVLNRYLEQNKYEANMGIMRDKNKRKRDTMYAALKDARELGVEMRKPEGGLYLWCRLPQNMNVRKLTSEANERGISFMPGNVFFLKGSKGENYIRLNYSIPSEEKITEGIALLNEAFKISIL